MSSLTMTGGEALARSLAPEGVEFVFGIAGGKLLRFMHALSRQRAIRYIGVRHEGSAALMAAGYYAATGRIAVGMAEVGPGASNLVSGAGSAFNNNLAALFLTSNNQHVANYPGRGMFMELDTPALFRPVTKWSAAVHDGRRIPELVRTAFREALGSGRPGPVHIDVPQDVLVTEYTYDASDFDQPPSTYRLTHYPRPAGEQIERAADLLAKAQRPLLIGGGGLARSGDAEAFRKLAALLHAPVTATQMGIGSVADDSPYFIGHGGAIGGPAIPRAISEADVILAVGCRFSSWLWDERGAMVRLPQKLIQIDIDPAAFGRLVPVAVGLQGDAAATVALLLEELQRRPMAAANGPWLAGLREVYAGYRHTLSKLADSPGEIMHPASLAQAVAAALPADALATYDGGHTSFWSNDYTPVAQMRTRFHEPGMAQLGFGTPYALACKLAHPNRPVFNIIGDGAFGFTLQELDTARRYGAPFISIVHNNAAWGVIRTGQRKALDFELGTDLADTNYADIARGFGCEGEVINRPEEVAPAIERALRASVPTVLDCRVRFEPHPSLPQFGKTSAVGLNAQNLLHAAPAR